MASNDYVEQNENSAVLSQLTDSDDDDNYRNIKEKFKRIHHQILTLVDNANILWSVSAATPSLFNYLPCLLIMNTINRSNMVFLMISNVQDSSNDSKTDSSEDNTQLLSSYDIYTRFNIGKIIKYDDIYYTKEYQRNIFQLARRVNVKEAMEVVHASMQTPVEIETLKTSDLMSVLLLLNDILYFNISHILIREHEIPKYNFIQALLLDKFERTLEILELPTFPNINSASLSADQIPLNATRDQIHHEVSQLTPVEKMTICNYFKALVDVFFDNRISLQNRFSFNGSNMADVITDMREYISLPSVSNDRTPIYVAASFLTDQFHVLRQHWRKNTNKDSKCTGTGKGIDGLQANQKGYEPPLGGKFIIIDWLKKKIVYTIDVDSASGFFIKNNHLYIANNRLNYISVIDLVTRIEIKRIKNSAFNCLHSMHLVENETILLTSTGIDAILQINFDGDIISEWYATEHGYSVTPKGEKRVIERNTDHDQYIYPTLHQTTHVNSAIILNSDYLLATLFHQGSLVKINRKNSESEVLLSGLRCPHAIKRYKSQKDNEEVWMLCSTKQNELLFLDEDFQIVQKMFLEDVNWLQDASQLVNKHLIIADANNSRIIEIDPNSYSVISEFVYSNDWRIYQINDLSDFQSDFIPNYDE